MNNKYKLLIALLLASKIVSADEITNKHSLPLKDSGIEIIPLAQIDLPDSMKEEDTFKSEQQKKIGYAKVESQYPRKLLSIKHSATEEIKNFKGNSDYQDTHMKKTISEIKLAFNYGGLKFIEPKNIIGFAPIMSYENGWTGVKEFFNDQKIGTCSYSLSNMKLMHGGIQLAKEDVTYDINNKPTTIEIEGSENSGFTYAIRWYDKTFAHELECANMLFDKSITENVLSLARNIDKN